jgi:hypothetical protein
MAGTLFRTLLPPRTLPPPTLRAVPRFKQLRLAQSRPILAALLADSSGSKERRNEAIRSAHLDHGYSLKGISDGLRLHYTSISKVVNDTLL